MSLKCKGFLVLAVLVTAGAVACGGGSSGSGGEAESADASSATPRVFFVAPMNETDHATEVPLGLTFGVENFQISAVPEEVANPREGLGHYHLGVNAECLPAGEIIPKADPWVHFGDGGDGMEL